MIQYPPIDPPAINQEEEARIDLELRSAADDLLEYDFACIADGVCFNKQEDILFKIYHSSGEDELLAVNDLKSLLFDTALELVKRGK